MEGGCEVELDGLLSTSVYMSDAVRFDILCIDSDNGCDGCISFI